MRSLLVLFLSKMLWRSQNTYPLLWACSTYWRKVKAVVNPWLDSCKHINTLCGISTILPYWTIFYRIEWARCEWVRLFILVKSSLHIIAWDLDVRDQAVEKSWMISNSVTQWGFVTIHIMLTTVKAWVLNEPYIHY